MRTAVALAATLLPLAPAAHAAGADWPTWRHDAARSAATDRKLPDKLHLEWTRRYPRLTGPWKDPLNRDRMQYDQAYEPIVASGTLFMAMGDSDKLVALDAATGAEKWRYYADGPIRLPPTVAGGRVYAVSDDGFLHCLDARDGKRLWRVRGGPDDRRVLGNERIISAWCVRGGPVVADGVVYFGAGIWPFMGTSIHAVDARTGKSVWINDGAASTFMLQPHNSPAFAGPAPQGSLAVAGEKLLVPNGRSVPAVFDRDTGKMLYYRLADSPKTGGAAVVASGEFFLNTRGIGTDMYRLSDGEALIGRLGKEVALGEGIWYFSGRQKLSKSQVAAGVKARPRVFAVDPATLRKVEEQQRKYDSRTRKYTMVPVTWHEVKELWSCLADATGSLIRAGDRLYAGGDGVLSAIRIPRPGDRPTVDWQTKIDGKVVRLAAAGGRLYAVTEGGTVCCFGAKSARAEALDEPRRQPASNAQAQAILDRAGVREGYAVVYGASAELLEGLAADSKLSIVAVSGEGTDLSAIRRRLDEAGLYGRRVAVHAGKAGSLKLPPYFASLTVVIGKVKPDRALLAALYRSMRPYDGVCLLGASDDLAQAVRAADLPGARLDAAGPWAKLVRTGPLPGADDWTHMYGTAANTVCSRDKLVRAPLGLLWFGGPSHLDVLPRHGHGPPELIVGGRLFIQGIGVVSARDVYTGRVLWKRQLEGLDTFGLYYDKTYKADPLDTSYNQVHIPGANARGSNMAAADDGLYVALKHSCVRLDPVTGKTLTEFALPADGKADPPTWGYLGVAADTLIGGAEMMAFPPGQKLDPDAGYSSKHLPFLNFSTSASRRLVAMDRRTGKVRWTFTARLGLRHNATAIGGGKVFCMDRLPPMVEQAYRRRGEDPPGNARVVALDLRTGRTAWETDENVYGTWLAYSAEHNVLLQAGRPSRDMLLDESGSFMVVRRADTGKQLWARRFRYRGPAIIHGRTVYTEGPAVDLLTGVEKTLRHPLTGLPVPWRYRRTYGCNYTIGAENLLTFRSAAAGYYNLATNVGTGNFGGFKSGCTSNLIAADGVLNAPDYTRTCTCSYQNQASLALVHMPDVETWTYSALPPPSAAVRRVGLNFGAPGDHMAPDGTLWLDTPSVGGPGPNPNVTIVPLKIACFRRHSSAVKTPDHAWVAASGAEGIRNLSVELVPPKAKPLGQGKYTITLYFCEPTEEPGKRLFHIALQGRQVLKDFDVAGAAGGPLRLVTRQFKGVKVAGKLTVELTPSRKAPSCKPILCGLEAVAEE